MGCTNEPAAQQAAVGSAPNAKVEITYFGMGWGRADPITQLLAHAGANYEVKGLDFAEWGQRKAAGKTAEFGAMPIV